MEAILDVKELSVTYKSKLPWKKGKCVVKNATFSIHEGEIVVILGSNGSGKSTLLKALVNSIDGDFDRKTKRGGRILFKGEDLLQNKTARDSYRLKIACSMQSDSADYYDAKDTIRTVLERVAQDRNRMSRTQAREKTNELLRYFNAESLADLSVRSLSGGQMRLLAIAECLIIEDAICYFIDEPYNDLDDDRARRVSNYLIDLHKKRPEAAIVIITHCKKIPNEDGKVRAYTIREGELSPTTYHHVLCLGVLKNGRYVTDE